MFFDERGALAHRRSGTRWNLCSIRRCMPIRTGWMVGPSSFAEYQPQTMSYGQEVPLGAVQSSCINELVFRGSQVQDSLTVALPRPSPGEFTDDVRRRNPTTEARAPSLPTNHARLSPFNHPGAKGRPSRSAMQACAASGLGHRRIFNSAPLNIHGWTARIQRTRRATSIPAHPFWPSSRLR